MRSLMQRRTFISSPFSVVVLAQVETYRFANMTVMPVIYEGALLKLPSAVVEFRPAFHEYTFNRFV